MFKTLLAIKILLMFAIHSYSYKRPPRIYNIYNMGVFGNTICMNMQSTCGLIDIIFSHSTVFRIHTLFIYLILVILIVKE